MARLKTNLMDLNDMLFEQLERITNDDLTGKELDNEIRRSKAVTDTAQSIINNSNLMLNVMKLNVRAGGIPEEERIEQLLGSGEK